MVKPHKTTTTILIITAIAIPIIINYAHTKTPKTPRRDPQPPPTPSLPATVVERAMPTTLHNPYQIQHPTPRRY